MTIKKPMKVTKPTAAAAEPVAGADPAAAPAGGATIADRFKLDAPEPKAKTSSGGTAALIAGVAALAALGVVGVLTFIMYQHWEFLKGA